MKRIAVLLLLSAVILSGCGLIPKVITSSTGEAPTPVEEVVDAGTATPPAESPTDIPVETPTETLAPEPQPTETQAAAYRMLAFVGADGNIQLKDLQTGNVSPLTADATKNMIGGDQEVSYSGLMWSSDGILLAYERQVAVPVSFGLDYTFALWVYDLNAGAAREILADMQTAGYAWRPGTHSLTYAPTIQEGYFTSRAEQDASKATGIWAIDVDANSAPAELVKPSAGFAVVNPRWSADGKIVAFEEVFGMEGTGNFAYFDVDSAEYVRREQQVGGYDLAPDGSRLVFDTMTYIANGMERIWVVNLDWTGAQRISPHYGEGYAFMPKLSPDGQQVAYLKGLGNPFEGDQDRFELFIQPVVETNEPLSFGVIHSPVTLAWMADGKSLILSVGTPDFMEIITVRLEDAAVDKLAEGSWPAMRP